MPEDCDLLNSAIAKYLSLQALVQSQHTPVHCTTTLSVSVLPILD